MNSVLLTYLFLIILFGVCLTPFLIALKRKKFDIFEIIYWASAYFLLIFFFRSLYLFSFGSPFLGQPPFSKELIIAWNISLIYLIVTFIIFLVSYYSKIGIAIANTLPKLPKEWSVTKTKVLLPIFLIIAAISYIILIKYLGGFSYYLAHKQATLTAGGTTYLSFGTYFLVYSFIISLICVFKYKKLKKLTFLFLLPLVLITGFFSGAKGVFLSPILMGVIVFHYFKKSIKLKHIILFFLLVILIIPIFNAYRHAENLSQLSGAFIDYSRPKNLIPSFISRFHMMDSMIYIIRDTPEVMDYRLGGTITPLFVSWIPRQIWSEKPIISFGKVFAETYYKEVFAGTGIAASSTIIGEGYINFHIAGILWVAFLAGIILRFFYQYLIKNNFGTSGVFIYSSLFLFFFCFWESNITGLIARATPPLIILIIISLLLSKRTIKSK